MKLEIKTKCAECGTELSGNNDCSPGRITINIHPCPNYHPAKAEKVTPKEGESVEVRGDNYPEGSHNTRLATGERHDGLVETNALNASTAWWDQWRYPGETEWRD